MILLCRILCMSGILLLTGYNGCPQLESAMQSEQQNTSSNVQNGPASSTEMATFAGGCFWGIEYNFGRIPGVKATRVGFMGGHVEKPSYKDVCYTDTNHAEVVQLRYDPDRVTYEQLVRIFFIMHDPTTVNRQGPDVGSQYRSAIFYHNPEQKEAAEKVKSELDDAGAFRRPIVTEITQADTFWKAEEYHQKYIEKNPRRSCHVVDFDEVKKILNES